VHPPSSEAAGSRAAGSAEKKGRRCNGLMSYVLGCRRRRLRLFHRHRVSRIRRTTMGVRVEVRTGESIEQALKRLRKLLWRQGPPGSGGKWPKWHKRPLDHYLKSSELRRRDELRDEFAKYAGECARRQVVCVIRWHCKRRKMHFSNVPSPLAAARYPGWRKRKRLLAMQI